VADVSRVVKIVAMAEHGLHDSAELLGRCLAPGGRRGGLVKECGGLADAIGRFAPGEDLAVRGLDLAEMVGEEIDEAAAGRSEQFGVIGGLDPLSGGADIGSAGHGKLVSGYEGKKQWRRSRGWTQTRAPEMAALGAFVKVGSFEKEWEGGMVNGMRGAVQNRGCCKCCIFPERWFM
jgi:hypothetical protein